MLFYFPDDIIKLNRKEKAQQRKANAKANTPKRITGQKGGVSLKFISVEMFVTKVCSDIVVIRSYLMKV